MLYFILVFFIKGNLLLGNLKCLFENFLVYFILFLIDFFFISK